MHQLTGKIISLFDIKEGIAKSTGNKWMLQQFLFETIEQYPKKILLELFGEDKIKFHNLQIGENVTVNFTINAREYNGKWYNSINVSNISKEAPQQPSVIPNTPVDDLDAIFGSTKDEDDVPF